ncbi:uncharacterized protein Z518_10167 [Rhinocladiella mackenziei CBS 650.93]|uniref:Rhinocladiella mackenziei CBS 650.93 unplaced genomic scaffold supercont1.8, whole genome shotgun sequence n=1 Tax=Rhinocladiella mackenziei CBS 650.93 TaxID=1442369 RepID=A0A0D2ICZ0_9EURO|nr:uncharacterized protein Z518_10167 [Rhinocladiella mackenziei CBS 650.93]KIX01101.1 hypothetical protein Z518_10167 [Rhinocladiella mackenziei CBS 650.93]
MRRWQPVHNVVIEADHGQTQSFHAVGNTSETVFNWSYHVNEKVSIVLQEPLDNEGVVRGVLVRRKELQADISFYQVEYAVQVTGTDSSLVRDLMFENEFVAYKAEYREPLRLRILASRRHEGTS